MEEMTAIVKAYFQTAGWFEGRDISDNFRFPQKKLVFPAAINIMKEFGYLKVANRSIDGDGFIYFDIDNSEASKVLRRDMNEQYFKYTSWSNDLYKKHGYFYNFNWDIENLDNTAKSIDIAGRQLCRLAYIEDYDAQLDIYIDEDGQIWRGMDTKPFARSFIQFCNQTMTGEEPSRSDSIADYNRY